MEKPGPLYSIGAVASLTGLSPNTLRTWDRRYGITSTARSPGGGRRYTEGDVSRLMLLRQLTSRGVAISSAAQLDATELRATLSQVKEVRRRPDRELRLYLHHPHLETRTAGAGLNWSIVGSSAGEKLTGNPLSCACDLLVADLDQLGNEPEALLEQLMEFSGATDALILYHFAPSKVLDTLSGAGARLIQEPVSLAELDEAARQQVRSREDEPSDLVSDGHFEENPEPRFLPQELARLRGIPSDIYCECPNHLATLVNSLLSFEEYSKTCASKTPADSILHRTLYEGTGAARTIIEALLEDVIAHEKIEVSGA